MNLEWRQRYDRGAGGSQCLYKRINDGLALVAALGDARCGLVAARSRRADAVLPAKVVGRVFRPADAVSAGITVVQMLREASVGTDWVLEEVTCVVF